MTSVNPVDNKLIRRLPAEIGTYLININWDKALTFLDEAIRILPKERYCIVNRAIARKKSMNIQGALDDVSAALKLDPKDLRVHAINNEILFLRKHFEKACVLNDRLSKLRIKPDYFIMGHLKCKHSVRNAIDPEYCGHPLRDHFKVIHRMAWEKATRNQGKKIKSTYSKKRSLSFRSDIQLLKQQRKTSKSKHSSEKRITLSDNGSHGKTSTGSSQENSEESILQAELRDDKTDLKIVVPKLVNYPFRPLQERTSNIENYLSEVYLEKLHKDKLFLKKLGSQKGFEIPNKRQEEKMRHSIDKSYKHLGNLQELLRSCRPFYHIKFQEKKNIARTLEYRKQIMNSRREEKNHAFQNIYRRIHEAYDTKNLRMLMNTVENLVELYTGSPKSLVNEHRKNIVESFKLLRDGHFCFGLFSQGMSEEDKIDRIKIALGIRMERAPSNDSLYKNLKQHHPTNWRAKIEITEERLKTARFIDEKIYFYYELARFYLEIGKTEFAVSFARRCLKNARENHDHRWTINAYILIAKANMRNSNKIDLSKALEKALHISRTGDCERMVEFLAKAVEVVRSMDFSSALDAKSVIFKRQKHILNLLKDNDTNRMEAEVLFKKLSYIPPKRTMSMIPGIKIADKNIQKEKHPCRRVKSAKATTNMCKSGLEFYDYIKDFLEV